MLPVVCHQFSSFTQSCLTFCNIWPKEQQQNKAVLQGVDEKLEPVNVEITSQR